MKIIQVSPRYPPRTGGVETHVRELSERLVQHGHDVTVLTADAGNDVSTQEIRQGVDVRRHRSFAPSDAFHFAPGIYGSVKRLDGDIVHAHNYHSLPLLFAALATDSEHFVATPHYHGGSGTWWRDSLLLLYRLPGGWTLRNAERVIAVSEWEAQQLSTDFDIDATVIRNGLDVDRFSGAEPEYRNRPYLLCVGRLEEYKGIQHAIRALSELDDYDLVVAGTGPYQQQLERVANEVDVRDRVEFLGFVDSDRLPGLYAGADVFLNLSSLEAYGMTVAEAIAAGTPCVVRKSGALTDWVQETGCVGVGSMEPTRVASAVGEAAELEGVMMQLSDWGEVTNRVLSMYRSIESDTGASAG